MPSILCIETSAAICSVAIIHNDEIYASESPKIQAHAEVLSALSDECLSKAGISYNNIDAIAISEGPGSYTGLRIGTSTAKGLCFALNIPLIPISTLKTIAFAALERENLKGPIWPMIDARRMEVYHCLFNAQLEPLILINNGIITDNDFRPSEVTAQTVICGDGALKAKDILGLRYVDVYANASSMCKLALDAFQKSEFANLERFEPFYLKAANITSSLKP